MLDKNNLIELGKKLSFAKQSAATSYSWNGQNLSYEAMQETFRNELKELAPDYASYRENKNLIFAIVEQMMDDIVPTKVQEAYDQFAEVRQFAQGDKPLFRRKLGNNNRAKQFITRVGLAGVYEVFKLGKNEETFEVPTSAIGGAVQIGFEEFLDGRVDWAEVVQIVMDGMDELISKEIAHAMKAAIGQLPPANRVAAPGFDEDEFDRLLMIAAAYGIPTIYCTEEFAVRMIPKDAWRYTEAMKDELYKNGRLLDYKGRKVVILPQGFEDGTNERKVIDPGYAWIIPAGADNKPVKVAFEGGTLVDEEHNRDWSREMHVYRKVGVVAMLTNNICCYVDTSLMGQMTTWHLNDGVNGVYGGATAG